MVASSGNSPVRTILEPIAIGKFKDGIKLNVLEKIPETRGSSIAPGRAKSASFAGPNREMPLILTLTLQWNLPFRIVIMRGKV